MNGRDWDPSNTTTKSESVCVLRAEDSAAQERIRQQAQLLDLTEEAIVVRTLSGRITFWNKGAEAVFGWTEAEVLGREFRALLDCDPEIFQAAKSAFLASGAWTGELHLAAKSGRDVLVLSRWNLLRASDGSPKAILSASLDVTEKKHLETLALRAQRMDGIGALAGGIAHDLNNALAPVLVTADLLKCVDKDPDHQKFLDIISSSARRARDMVEQILGFARGAENKVGPLVLTTIIREMARLIRETFPKSIAVESNIPDQNLWPVHGDATALHQVLLNLCVNARDAIVGPGRIALGAQNVTLDRLAGSALSATPGRYVLLSVSDTGIGIPADVLPRIFEPFFTTKTAGAGTGLGLSTVATIVKQHHGFLEVKTEPGQGSQFRVFLPAAESPAAAPASAQNENALPTGHGELILVMDDEEALRELAKATLESYGYRVVTVQNGVQGVATFEQRQAEISLVLCDADMPVMDGATAMRAIQQLRPAIPSIFVSGSRAREQLKGVNQQHMATLSKPYTLEQLLVTVAAALQE